MLARLSIRDIVLIDRLDIDFASGLSVLTGETGAGKSILLDAFALALGARGDATLVRQGAGVVLAVDFNERGAQRLQRLHADRLVVDEGAGAAVGKLHAAQDHGLIGGDIARRKQRARRMPGRNLEHRNDLTLLGALPHQPGIAARAERQRKGIEQDRLARAGLAG